MARLFIFFFAFLLAGMTVGRAADPARIFGTLLGEIQRQVERKQHNKQLNRLRPLWQACSNGDVSACDRAGRFPNLTDQARNELRRMRQVAEERPAYVRNFHACQRQDRGACSAALAYPYASPTDRTRLRNWLRAADEDAQRRLRREQQQRRRLAEFRRNEQNCHAGSASACNAALADRHLDESASRNIERQRTRLRLEADQRRKRERRLQASRHEYAALRQACIDGQRQACGRALDHPSQLYLDIALLKRRQRELAPVTERLFGFVSGTSDGEATSNGAWGGLALGVFGAVAFAGVMFGIRHVRRNREAGSQPHASDPPSLAPKPARDRSAGLEEPVFPLTGHLPTDVRRALYGAEQ